MASNTESVIQGAWLASEKLPFFDGHFPGRPVLPAVATIDLCVGFLKEQLNRPKLRVVAVRSAKFGSPILPGTWVETTCTCHKEGEWRCLLKEKDSSRLLADLTVILS